ncbi:glycosyltransferase [Cytobacillus firmus]|uniref:glycosyltransferase n=1 Tax=Cytobacillus firmus TaxID=1399 RepID=UPI0024C1B433|nr:glycosyltransferase [Cytobacillus firmus]WHY61510.1 glycosyltransferase [Cytobacillus firmus]
MVSVVMSVYNEKLDMIVKAIESMIHQTYQGDMEIIIVVDDPNNKEILNLLRDYEKRFNNIKLLINSENKGLAYSLNRGITYAKGRYICRMDADDISFPERIEKELAFLKENSLDFVSSTAIPINDEDQVIGEKIKVPLTQKEISRVIKYSGCLIHPTWLFTKKSWLEIGGYREGLVAAQDYDYSIRMIQSGYRVATIKAPLLNYRIRSNAISVSKRALQTYLGLYSQNNVYRNAHFDNGIYIKIQSGSCGEYNQFENSFNKFVDSNNKSLKIFRLIEGCCKSRVFCRFVYNSILLRFTKSFIK